MVTCEEWLNCVCPYQGGKKGRSRNSRIQEITTGMRAKGLRNIEWIDGEEWGR